MKTHYVFLSLLIIMAVFPISYQTYAAPLVSIETNQSVYHYGDFLSMTINVSEITGDNATVYIIDPNERKSILLNPTYIKED